MWLRLASVRKEVDVQTFKLDFEIKASDGAYGPVKKKTLRKLLKNIVVLAKKKIDFRFLLKTTTRASDGVWWKSDGVHHKFCKRFNIIGLVAFVVIQ